MHASHIDHTHPYREIAIPLDGSDPQRNHKHRATRLRTRVRRLVARPSSRADQAPAFTGRPCQRSTR